MGIRYVAGYTTQLPAKLRISFICEYCGHKNEIIRTKTFKGSDVGGFLNRGTIDGARQDLISDIKRAQDNISNNRYQDLELDCQCEACKRKPIWSSFLNTSLSPFAVALVISLLVAIIALEGEAWPLLIICGVVFVVAVVTICYFEIYNSKIKKKCDRTNREFLPFISIEPLNSNYNNSHPHASNFGASMQTSVAPVDKTTPPPTTNKKDATNNKVVPKSQLKTTANGLIICPTCGKEQKADRACCYSCGTEFVDMAGLFSKSSRSSKGNQGVAGESEVIEHIKSSLGKVSFDIISVLLQGYPNGFPKAHNITEFICTVEAVLLNVVTLCCSDESNTLRGTLLLKQYEGFLHECQVNNFNYIDTDCTTLFKTIMPLHDWLISDDIIEAKIIKINKMESLSKSSNGLYYAYTTTLFELLGVKPTNDEYASMCQKIALYYVWVAIAINEFKENKIIDTSFMKDIDLPNTSYDKDSITISPEESGTSTNTQERFKASFCRRCGSQLVEGASFCKECGLPVVTITNVDDDRKPSRISDELPKENEDMPAPLPKDSMPKDGITDDLCDSIVQPFPGEASAAKEENVTEDFKESKECNKRPVFEIDYHNKNLHPKIRRAFLFFEDGEWDRADACLEDVLNEDPTSAYAYIGKLMIDLKLKSTAELKNYASVLGENKYYQKAVRFADEELSKTFLSIQRRDN